MVISKLRYPLVRMYPHKIDKRWLYLAQIRVVAPKVEISAKFSRLRYSYVQVGKVTYFLNK